MVIQYGKITGKNCLNTVVRMCQAENHLDELQQQIKTSNHCSDEERD